MSRKLEVKEKVVDESQFLKKLRLMDGCAATINWEMPSIDCTIDVIGYRTSSILKQLV